MLTVADMGEGGVKNGQKSADVLYGRPLKEVKYELKSLGFCKKIETLAAKIISGRCQATVAKYQRVLRHLWHPTGAAPALVAIVESLLAFLQRGSLNIGLLRQDSDCDQFEIGQSLHQSLGQ